MASKWINAILWSLVSINFLILVLGGLVTWLGYAIPIRLRQFGLSPEITQLAGFASLLVACLGLGGLNYSSHYALNAYGISCAIFIILMLLGALPDHWQQAIYNPSADSSGVAGHKQQQQPLLANTTNSTTLTNTDQKRPKPDQPPGGGFILDLLYIVLLLILSFLLTMALIVAQYLRRRELEEAANVAANNIDCEDELADCYSKLVTGPAHGYSLRAGGVECNPMTALARQRQLIIAPPPAATNNRNSITDWNCTCSEFLREGGINRSHLNEQVATMTTETDVADNEFVPGRIPAIGAVKDEIRSGRRQVSNIVASACDDTPHKVIAGSRELAPRVSNHSNEARDPAKRRSLQSVTLDQWMDGRGQVNGVGRRRHTSRLSSRLANETDKSLSARRVSSKSLADLAINNNGCGDGDNDADDSDDELLVDTDDDAGGAGCGRRNDRVASISGAVQAGEQPKISLVAPLVQKGIYYASGRGHEFEDCANSGCLLSEAADEVALLGGYHTLSGRSSQRRHQLLNNEHRHNRDPGHCYNHHYRHHHRHGTEPGRKAGPSCCPADTALSYMPAIPACDMWFGLSHHI